MEMAFWLLYLALSLDFQFVNAKMYFIISKKRKIYVECVTYKMHAPNISANFVQNIWI
jgi:hypothetical protein